LTEAVTTTKSIIRLVWKEVYGKVNGPLWLSVRDKNGHYSKQGLTVAPKDLEPIL